MCPAIELKVFSNKGDVNLSGLNEINEAIYLNED